MKGRMSNICRANGGSVGKMRDIAGYKAPSYGTDTSVLKAAEGKTVGMIPDGEGARGRLDRPGRKHGGSVGKHPHFLEGIKEGALRKELGTKEGEKIPAKKLEKAAHSDDPMTKKRAVLAENMRHWSKKKD